jgi:hypothetical protein
MMASAVYMRAFVPQNTGGEQLSSCLRDALRQYFPQQAAQGKSYLPIDDSRFKNWIPAWVKAGVAITPGAVNPAAITLGLFDILLRSEGREHNGWQR